MWESVSVYGIEDARALLEGRLATTLVDRRLLTVLPGACMA